MTEARTWLDRKVAEVEALEEAEAISAELIPTYRALPLFLVGTGMRPDEALALEWKASTGSTESPRSSVSTRAGGRSRA